MSILVYFNTFYDYYVATVNDEFCTVDDFEITFTDYVIYLDTNPSIGDLIRFADGIYKVTELGTALNNPTVVKTAVVTL